MIILSCTYCLPINYMQGWVMFLNFKVTVCFFFFFNFWYFVQNIETTQNIDKKMLKNYFFFVGTRAEKPGPFFPSGAFIFQVW